MEHPAPISIPPRILRRPQVEYLTGLSRSTLYAYIAQATFPKPIRLGARSVGWLQSEIEAWTAARVASSRSAA